VCFEMVAVAEAMLSGDTGAGAVQQWSQLESPGGR
jgi:hypothetical protein